MVDFYGKSSKKWKILEVLDTENASLADGYKFLIILEVAEINDFFLKNKAKPESLLNDPKEHYKTVFLRNPSLSEKVEYNKSNFFSHSVKLKGLNRETLLFICIDLDKNLVIFDYTEP